MSDREFENYLMLLAGLLKLRGSQRQEIADELRSHLEDRLDELLAQGVSRDEAIKQALAEFGDAAGLAGQFVAISRQRKRRWLVRMTTFSVTASLLIAASLITFWPGRNAAPGRADAIAQQPEQKELPRAVPKGPGISSATQRIETELDKLTTVDFVEAPLKDVVLFLSELHQIPIYMKVKKLEEASITVDKPVTLSLKGVRLASALELILDELELTYFVRDVLVITTPEDAENHLETRVYDCRDLLAMPHTQVPQAPQPPRLRAAEKSPDGGTGGVVAKSGGMGAVREQPTDLGERTDELIEIITGTVRPDSWDDVGGPGAIDAYNGLFVVSQTAKVHKDVEHVLDMLRQAAGLDVVPGSKVIR